MKKKILISLILLNSFFMSSQNFEGIISMKKENFIDTSYLIFYFKNQLIRVDEKKENCEERTLLINLKLNSLIALSHSRKMFTKIKQKPYEKSIDTNFIINKTQTIKKIKNYNCRQWRVKNKIKDIEIAYWVTSDFYPYFERILKLINRNEDHLTFFLKIPDVENTFPLQIEEYTILKEKKNIIKIDKIEKKLLEKSIFRIPDGYIEF
ncbi:MAG: hypothetical protein B6I24_07195 [Bacteroidetes bacterium 4572_128]|nr:MAG: hypothetical protein B6I24_07195 [Bacteroidetes bacterium 4572_128]